jgi:hypothetical protein
LSIFLCRAPGRQPERIRRCSGTPSDLTNHGKLKACRDYFDANQFSSRMG